MNIDEHYDITESFTERYSKVACKYCHDKVSTVIYGTREMKEHLKDRHKKVNWIPLGDWIQRNNQDFVFEQVRLK